MSAWTGEAAEYICARVAVTHCQSSTHTTARLQQIDSDSSSATPCTSCPAGQYWQGPTALNTSTCVQCEAGRADLDSDSTTGCVECGVGQFAAGGGIFCNDCSRLDLVDHDMDASTPCVDANTQCTQLCPPGFGDDDCNPVTPCIECIPGRFKLELQTGECIACPSGRYETQHASLSCNHTCSAADGIQCPGQGSAYPFPVAGYYMVSDKVGVGLESLAKCTPPQGCLGGAYGDNNCAVGYGGLRCAQCLDDTEVGPGEDPNGYYRKDSLCVPCGKVIPVWILGAAGAILFVATALMADKFLMQVADVSNFIAPVLILLTFFQTVSAQCHSFSHCSSLWKC